MLGMMLKRVLRRIPSILRLPSFSACFNLLLNGHSKFIRFKPKQHGFSEASSKSSSNCMAANIKENKTLVQNKER